MTTKESPSSNKKVGFLLTEIAMGLLDYKYFDLDGRPVNDLQSFIKYQREEVDYSKDEKDLAKLLKISKNCLNPVDSCYNITDTIDLDEPEDNSNSIEVKEKLSGEKESCTKQTSNVNQSTSKIDIETGCDSKKIILNPLESDEETETETEQSRSTEHEEPNPSLIKSKLRSHRIKYLTDLTRCEFLKIKQIAKIRKKEFLKKVVLGKTKQQLVDFYKEEKQHYETESDALISFIKVVKKSEFPNDVPHLNKFVTQISCDIMEAKNNIEWETFF